MNTTGKLFTGIVALVLIGTACIVPLYIADKWHEMEMSGRGAVPVSDLFLNNTNYITDTITVGEDICVPFKQSNSSTMVVLDNRYNNQFYGKITSYFKYYNVNGGYYTLEDYSYFDYNEYDWDTLTFPFDHPSYSLVWVYMDFFYLVSAQEMLDNDASHMKVHFNVSHSGAGLSYQILNAQWGFATAINGAVSLQGTEYSPYTAYSRHPSDFWLNFTEAQLLSASSFQNGRAYKVFHLRTYASSPPKFHQYTWNLDIYQDYYDPETMNIHTYSNSTTNETTFNNITVWTGADVTVSYLDIQRWILGSFGIGIAILALAVSPFWNPIKDYAYRTRRK